MPEYPRVTIQIADKPDELTLTPGPVRSVKFDFPDGHSFTVECEFEGDLPTLVISANRKLEEPNRGPFVVVVRPDK